MEKAKKDGTLTRKPGRKPTVKNDTVVEEKKAPVLKSAQEAAWARIADLAGAIIRQKEDEKLVDRWAQEITWQCTMIGAMKDYDGQRKAGD